jgi:hypothetical protein
MYIDENEIQLQKDIVEQYIALQEINQKIIDSLPLNPLTIEIVSNYIDHPCFGLPGKNYQKKIDGRYNEALSTALLFGVTGLIGGIFLAAPATIFGSLLVNSHIINKIYTTIHANQAVISNAAQFYFNNSKIIDLSFDSTYFSKLSKRTSLSNKDFLTAYTKLFSYYHDLMMSFDVLDEKIEQSASEEHQCNSEDSIINDDKNSKHSDLIISDEILFNSTELENLAKVNFITEIELLATISVLEEELDDESSDPCRIEEISRNILPKLREILDSQSKSQ